MNDVEIEHDEKDAAGVRERDRMNALTCTADSMRNLTTMVGTLLWQRYWLSLFLGLCILLPMLIAFIHSPEVLNGQNYSLNADVYSYAITLWVRRCTIGWFFQGCF